MFKNVAQLPTPPTLYTIHINIAYVHVYIINKHVNQIEDPKNTTTTTTKKRSRNSKKKNKMRCDLVITLYKYTNEYIYIYIYCRYIFSLLVVASFF